MLKQVVLPAPFGPISASISPATSVKLTSSTAWMPPNAFDSPRTASSGAALMQSDALAAPRDEELFSPPATPSGNTSTSASMTMPSSARQ